MADRSVVIRLGMNVTGLVASARTGTRAMQQMGAKGLDWTHKNQQSINQVANGLGTIGLVGVAAAGIAIKRFADFDQQMSHVAATGDDARANLDALRQAAIDAGAETAFSAGEAAAAIENLAKAGVSANDILGGGLAGALDLAAAGGLDVAEAAEIAATAMSQFNLGGEDMTHIADLLAAGAGKAQGDVRDMGMALKQAGLVADQTGLSIEETTGGLAAFAEKGLLGSDAGTSFKSMLQRLTPQSAEAASEMERLGISAFDSQGEFIGLAEFAGNLKNALKSLTPEQRNAAMATIFGSDAVRAANVLYQNGEAGIRNWISAVDDQGFAAETAATRMDNLKGDIEAFLGSLETAFIGAGEGADGPLRKLVQAATSAVNAFNDLPGPVKTALLAIVGGGGLVALGVAGLAKLAIGVSNTRGALSELGVMSGRSGTAIRGMGRAIGFASGALAGMLILSEVTKLFKESEGDIRRWSETIEAAAGSAPEAKIAALKDELKELQKETDAGIVTNLGFADVYWNDWDGSMVKAHDRAEALKERIKELEHEQKKETLEAEATGVAQDGMAEATGSATEEVQAQADALGELVDGMQAAGLATLDVRDAQRQVEQAVDDARGAIKSNGKTLDITTQKGRDNEAALHDIAKSALGLADAQVKAGKSGDTVAGSMKRARTQFINAAVQAGKTREQARKLADKLGLIPGNYKANITTPGADNARNKINSVADAIRNLPNKTRLQVSANFSGIKAVATGGYITGPGGPTEDKAGLYALSNGEYVMKAASVQKYGRKRFDQMNAGIVPAEGGPASSVRIKHSVSGANKLKATAADFADRAAKSAQSYASASGKVLPAGTYRVGRGPEGHGYNARDLPAPTGTPIFAAAAGIVSTARRLGYSYGTYARLQHAGFSTLYAHMSQMFVRAGQEVGRGQMIGRVGSTGNSTGPHLHLEPDLARLYDKGGKWASGTLGINTSGGTETVLNPAQSKTFDRMVVAMQASAGTSTATTRAGDDPRSIAKAISRAINGATLVIDDRGRGRLIARDADLYGRAG